MNRYTIGALVTVAAASAFLSSGVPGNGLLSGSRAGTMKQSGEAPGGNAPQPGQPRAAHP
ncbi:MAG TPA: hypothetical protein VF503_27495 [Sphingobium sp.]|uniref:hypothetical protein n=1 Tax=Sphingobium sp. TaxID=1912891 RepID=UPI002ED4F7B3